jgi:hypothetical protein
MPKPKILLVGLDTLTCSNMGVSLSECNTEIMRDRRVDTSFIINGNFDVVITNNVTLTREIKSCMSSPPIVILINKWMAEPRPHGANLFISTPVTVNGSGGVIEDIMKNRKSRSV